MEKITNTLLKYMKLCTVAVIVISCGGEDATLSDLIAEGDLSAVQVKKKELTAQQKAITKHIALLDSVIAAKSNDENYPLITVLNIREQDFVHYIELQGDVTTKQNVLVYPEVAGTLVRVHVKEGHRVKAGQLLASIDDGGLSNQLIQMKAQLALAKTTYERQSRLWEQKIGSEIQFLESKTNYESQAASVKQMEDQLSKYAVRAPFSGIVDDVIKDQGTVVAPGGSGSEVFRIVNLSDMYLKVPVPETYIATITKGKRVKVEFPILNESVESYVRETGNFINPNNRSFTVEIPVENKSGNVKPNLTAKVHINDYRNETALLIPQNTVSENAEGEQYAYIVTNPSVDHVATARKTVITTGKTQGDFVEVLSGIEAGQSIIVEGARSVKDGQKVKILKS
ncbi:MAG: efflux RND transporter periplasmic adaptor subunit [Ekhidna sp.]|nr:efflux RND transporter periplasmic adaptor subunit [Ekhidna sp.]